MSIQICILVGIMNISALGQDAILLCERAHDYQKPFGAPKYSDVSMRLFRQHEDNKEIDMGKAFHITRADWSYIKDKDYIDRIHRLGWTFQGSMNSITHNPDFALKDEQGNPMLDHFKREGRFYSDSRNQAYRDWYLNNMIEWVELGVDAIQRDEPDAHHRWSIAESVQFYKDLHSELFIKMRKRIPFSLNLGWNKSMLGGKGGPITALFDFGMAELNRTKVRPQFFYNASLEARQRGQFLVYTTHQNLGLDAYRKAIAGCYATGMLFIVPWDQFGGVSGDRVFMQPEQLADLYGFVRANSQYLDQYEDAVVAGYELQEFQAKDNPVQIVDGPQISACVRAIPDNKTAPVVIHLVDWQENGAFQLKLADSAFFGDANVKCELRIPVPYDPNQHQRAEKTKNYAPLSKRIEIPVDPQNGWLVVDIPALDPWGILVVSEE